MLQLSLFCFIFYPLLAYSFQNSSSQLCHHDDKIALLQFKNSFTIQHPSICEYTSYDSSDSGYSAKSSYPKTKSWKENKDCCLWDGVICDSISGHVIELDLSCSQLRGIIHPNSTLFHLSHLQTLNLAFNSFYPSHISPNMARFTSLKVLNLSKGGFIGHVPINLSLLSQLVSLDLSSNPVDISDRELKMPNIDKIMRNLTSLRELFLGGVSINSKFPQTLANLSSLSKLDLSDCGMRGSFPSNILRLPHLQSLTVDDNVFLYVDASHFNNLSRSLQVIDFASTNLTGQLPEYTLGSQPPQLRKFLAWGCNLYGGIPMWIWNTTERILLGGNKLSGKLPSHVNPKQLSNLTRLDLSYNWLNGTIPSWLMNLPSLKYLLLSDNQFTGNVPKPLPKGNCLLEQLYLGNNYLSLETSFLTKCNHLSYVDLSYTSLTGGANSTFFLTHLPNLSYLYMSSCNITKFPSFYSSQQPLIELDLSNNKIQGQIPTWFYEIGRDSLNALNISYNNLTGGLNLLSWNSLDSIDLRSNSLRGSLPLPPPNTTRFFASNNKFDGEINSLFCDLKQLLYLDLSKNHLNGTIPKCLGKLSYGLEILDLGSNLFHGVIHMTFVEGCYLKSIHLNNNNFEGKLPRSLMRCNRLEVLDLRNNRFNDSFPHWLQTLPELKVLVLKSNNFRGLIEVDSREYKHSFPKLQILDLSDNQFYGKLPLRFFKMFKALMIDNGGSHNKGTKYVGEIGYYQDSLVLTMKGLSLEYKILNILAALDLSNNSFSGEIPDSIGELVALVALNVSHNQLTGHIPSSLANLSALESLDLSCNMLNGKIPPQLVRLTFLAVFNVSKNQLVGTIPQSTQFSTFPNDSFGGNPGLCGDPLPKCGESGSILDHQPTTVESQQEGNGFIDKITSISLLEVVLLGFGVGVVWGSSIGYCMLTTRKPNWFSRNADRFEGVVMQRFKIEQRRPA